MKRSNLKRRSQRPCRARARCRRPMVATSPCSSAGILDRVVAALLHSVIDARHLLAVDDRGDLAFVVAEPFPAVDQRPAGERDRARCGTISTGATWPSVVSGSGRRHLRQHAHRPVRQIPPGTQCSSKRWLASSRSAATGWARGAGVACELDTASLGIGEQRQAAAEPPLSRRAATSAPSTTNRS